MALADGVEPHGGAGDGRRAHTEEIAVAQPSHLSAEQRVQVRAESGWDVRPVSVSDAQQVVSEVVDAAGRLEGSGERYWGRAVPRGPGCECSLEDRRVAQFGHDIGTDGPCPCPCPCPWLGVGE